MSPAPSPAPPLPTWAAWPLSIAIVVHLLAITSNVLAAPSGPWPSPEGMNMSTPPQFAATMQSGFERYLKATKLTHNYHFATNRPGQTGVWFEVQLHDADGKDIGTVKFPDENANPWVRHRQLLLAQALTEDMPVMPPQTESVAAPSGEVPHVTIWDSGEGTGLKLRRIPEHLIPRDRPVFRPSDWSMLAARAYARYLCRTHDAKSAVLIRHTREAIPPAVMVADNFPAAQFEELISNFGELPR